MKGFALARIAAGSLLAVGAPVLSKSCPIEGDAQQQLARELNPLKNRDLAPTPQDIDPSATLTNVLRPGSDLDRWSTNKAAIFDGYVVGVKMGGIESVNCHAKDPAHRDTHIELALGQSAAPRQRVTVEVTPRWRDKIKAVADWSTAALKKELLPGGVPQRVRITGWLFADLEHKPQAENSNPRGAHNWRATVWEIHPITGIQLLTGATANARTIPPAHRTRARRHVKRATRCAGSKGHACRKAVRKPPHKLVPSR